MQITEANQSVFWTEMAPNVDDYDNRVAKTIASGTGQIIRGIFWVRDSTVVKLENGTLNRIQRSNSTDKPMNLRPSTLRNLERYVERMSLRVSLESCYMILKVNGVIACLQSEGHDESDGQLRQERPVRCGVHRRTCSECHRQVQSRTSIFQDRSWRSGVGFNGVIL